jgi:uncharacterized protein (DUF433 family)
MDYSKIITIERGKRSGKPCIRGLRITVSDVLDYLASGMSAQQILRDFPELTEEDLRACSLLREKAPVGLAHSTSWRMFSRPCASRSVLECGSLASLAAAFAGVDGSGVNGGLVPFSSLLRGKAPVGLARTL